jgi:Co/Zn/Cd efflux system component
MTCREDDCCAPPQTLNSPQWRRALWIAFAVNVGFFLGEMIAGLAAGSAALQADALDFFGDAANYAISLGVAGLALAWRARAALVKGGTLIVFALWVLGSTAWHAINGTLPQAEVMGVVGVAALIANGGIAVMLYRSAPATRTCAQSGSARAMTQSAMLPCCWRHWACSAPAPAGPTL